MTGQGDVGSGWAFGAELAELYEAGLVIYPDLAHEWWNATAQVDAAATVLPGIRATLPPSGQDFLSAFSAALDQGQRFLAMTTDSLSLTGTALVGLAQDYAATDQAAADMFAAEIADIDQASVPAPLPPAPQPDADTGDRARSIP